MPQIKRFKGLNNVSDPLRLGLDWLEKADNINITDTGALIKRDGYTKVSTGVFSGMYSTADFTRMYFVDAGQLRTLEGAVLMTGLSALPMYWAEINEQVFFNNGIDSGIIMPDNSVLPWRWAHLLTPVITAGTGTLAAGDYRVRIVPVLPDGRRLGTSDPGEITLNGGQSLIISGISSGSLIYIAPANSDVYSLAGAAAGSALVWNSGPDMLGEDMPNAFLDPLPEGTDVLAFYKSRVFAAQYFASADQTVVWYSEPLGFHLFNLNVSFFIVPGHVHMLADAGSVLLVGTGAKIYAYSDKLDLIADYGVVPGQHWALDKDAGEPRAFFWTTRGLCSAMPFTNLTERQVSVAPGINAGGTIVRSGGQKRYLVSMQQGGSAFNPRT